MFEGYHFAQDDPILYPQPYIPDIGFLAIIPRAPGKGTISTAFHRPSTDDFQLRDPESPWLGIGTLRATFLSEVKLMVEDVHHKYRHSILTSDPDPLNLLVCKAERLMLCDCTMQRLLQRLLREPHR
jgi:hypothetical protein